MYVYVSVYIHKPTKTTLRYILYSYTYICLARPMYRRALMLRGPWARSSWRVDRAAPNCLVHLRPVGTLWFAALGLGALGHASACGP